MIPTSRRVADTQLALESRYQHLLNCPELIDTRDHLPLFRSLAGRILEIGTNVGNSTTAFLVGESESVSSIDINPQCAGNFPGESKWRFVAGDSRSTDTYRQVWNEADGDGLFDVLFVDGAHDYDSCLSDLRMYSQLVKNGGVIMVHDVLATDNFPGVWLAFRRFDWNMSGQRVKQKYILPGSYGLGVIEL